jgi:hypothetical protein
MPQVTIRTATGELVTGELVTGLPGLNDQQIRHVREVAARWNREPEDRTKFKSLPHLLLWWDGLGCELPAIEWHLLNLGIEYAPGAYAGPGPWMPDYNPEKPLDSGINWRKL